MREFFLFIGIVGGVLGAIFGSIYLLANWDCTGYQAATGRVTKFVHGSCYAQLNGTWYTQAEYDKILVPQRLGVEVK